jgi:cytochrome c biogenesis protein CcmG/thiol:disulfide interchange protein DsbE
MSEQLDSPAGVHQGGRHLARTAAVVVGIVVVALVALLATRKTGASDGISKSAVGRAVPQVQGTTLDGAHFDIDDHLGQFTVVDFFGSWCAPCHAEQGELVKFAKEHANDPNVSMVGIMYRDKKSDAQAFYRTTHATWPILNDDGTTAISFGVTGVPETYVVDPNGEVVAKFEAGLTASALDGVLRRFGDTSESTTSVAPSTTAKAGT